MEENKQTPCYTLYYSLNCPKCQRFLQAVRPLTTARYINYYDVQRKRPPPEANIKFVPSLVDNHTGLAHVGSQAFDLLKLWLQGEQLKSFTPMSEMAGQGALQYANIDDGLLDQEGLFSKLTPA